MRPSGAPKGCLQASDESGVAERWPPATDRPVERLETGAPSGVRPSGSIERYRRRYLESDVAPIDRSPVEPTGTPSVGAPGVDR